MDKLSKKEQKIARKAASQARARANGGSKTSSTMARAATFGGAFVGQKFLGGAKGPAGIPMTLAVGGAVVALEMAGQVGKTKNSKLIVDLANGLIAGELGVMGYLKRTPVLGGG